MSLLPTLIGQRIRSYRLNAGLSQEKVAELSGCHPTYIGQLERGEKNATIDSISKIASALDIPLSKLFENIDLVEDSECDIPTKCYNFLLGKTLSEQEAIYTIITEIDRYKEL